MAQTYTPPLTFPYPTGNLAQPRPAGQGCVSCVHKRYCPAFYWHIRFIEREMPKEYGLACSKWSDNVADRLRPKGEGDFYQVEKMEMDGIAREPNQNGADDFNI